MFSATGNKCSSFKKLARKTKENTILVSICLVNQNIDLGRYSNTLQKRSQPSIHDKPTCMVLQQGIWPNDSLQVYISPIDNNQTITSSKTSMANMVHWPCGFQWQLEKWLLVVEAEASVGVNQLGVLEEYQEDTESAAVLHWENCCQETEVDVPEEESAALWVWLGLGNCPNYDAGCLVPMAK